MKKIIVLIIIALLSISVKAQSKEPILYIFPDSVEVKLFKHIDESLKYYPDGTTTRLFLSSLGDNRYNIIPLFTISDQPELDLRLFWANKTNRFAIVGEDLYPLVLDYDHKFSTIKPEAIGSFGNRDEQILRSHLINDGYSITWKWIDGKIHVEENHGLVIRKDATNEYNSKILGKYVQSR